MVKSALLVEVDLERLEHDAHYTLGLRLRARGCADGGEADLLRGDCEAACLVLIDSLSRPPGTTGDVDRRMGRFELSRAASGDSPERAA